MVNRAHLKWSDTNKDRMFGALNRAVVDSLDKSPTANPIHTLGIWVNVPGDAPEVAPLPPGTEFVTAEGGHEVRVDYGDPGGDGISPVCHTVSVTNFVGLVGVTNDQLDGAGFSLPSVDAAVSDPADAALAAMTRRVNMLVLADGSALQFDCFPEGWSEPSPLEEGHAADVLLRAFELSTPPPSSADTVHGLLSVWYLRIANAGQRQRASEVFALSDVGSQNSTEEFVSAMSAAAATMSWADLFEMAIEAAPKTANWFDLGSFSRAEGTLLHLATAQCDGRATSALRRVRELAQRAS